MNTASWYMFLDLKATFQTSICVSIFLTVKSSVHSTNSWWCRRRTCSCHKKCIKKTICCAVVPKLTPIYVFHIAKRYSQFSLELMYGMSTGASYGKWCKVQPNLHVKCKYWLFRMNYNALLYINIDDYYTIFDSEFSTHRTYIVICWTHR